MEKFCITMLLHNAPDRADALRRTFIHLAKGCLLYPEVIPVYILVNQTNSDIDEELEFITSRWQDVLFDFHIEKLPENIGCGAGINYLNDWANDYEYTLFLECDWILKEDTTPTWLDSAISFMNNYPNVDGIYFRRFRNDYEVRAFGGEDFLTIESFNNTITHNGIPFRLVTYPRYTNNPVLRRNKSFYDAGIFPLPIPDAVEEKGSGFWSSAEGSVEYVPQENQMLFYYADFGYFLHQDPQMFQVSNEHYSGTTNFSVEKCIACKHGLTQCKWGFCNQENELFCDVCETPEITETYSAHDARHIKVHHTK